LLAEQRQRRTYQELHGFRQIRVGIADKSFHSMMKFRAPDWSRIGETSRQTATQALVECDSWIVAYHDAESDASEAQIKEVLGQPLN
jgi:hypothetical protein